MALSRELWAVSKSCEQFRRWFRGYLIAVVGERVFWATWASAAIAGAGYRQLECVVTAFASLRSEERSTDVLYLTNVQPA